MNRFKLFRAAVLSKQSGAGVILSVALWLSLIVTTSANAGSEAAIQLKQVLDNINSIDATFAQTLSDADGQVLQELDGSLQMKRPSQFHWQTNDPYPQSVITDGKTLWLYDIDLEQVTVKNLDIQIEQTPAVLLSGTVEGVEANFDVSLLQHEKGLQQFTLVSKQSDSSFKQFQLEFKQNQLKVMRLFDQLDQVTEIVFANINQNIPLKDSLFQFKPPQGVDVISEM